MSKEKQDNTERGPKPMSDEEIKNSVMGQNTEWQDRMRGSGGRRQSRDSDD